MPATSPRRASTAMTQSKAPGEHRLRRGLDLPLAGAPAQQVDPVVPRCPRVALVAADYPGIKPSFLVQPGDEVLRGTPLFEDKRHPGVRFTSPAAGRVAAINRGDRRAFLSLSIDVAPSDGPDAHVRFAARPGASAAPDAAAVTALLVESGLWTALRTRPFGVIPKPGTRPAALFVTAIDTRPHAPEVGVAMAGREGDFRGGVAALATLTDGPVYVCTAPGANPPVPADPRIRVETFAGPHPAGLPGTHIHLLAPVDHGTTAWHIGYQDVAAIGHLFATGTLDVERIASLAGPGVLRPRLVRTRLGASLDALVGGELAPGDQRVVSGSVLDGRAASGEVDGWLGRHHLQVSALPEGHERLFFGWITPGGERFSLWRVVAGAFSRRGLALNTSTNGSLRAMVPIGAYERVMPLDILPTFLLRALIIGDAERAEALGALELDEEDLALCTLVCPGKVEYGPLLRATLARLEKEAA
jgi:Na+-transporting NADH:ubiquinone oxidoreductase subunit A